MKDLLHVMKQALPAKKSTEGRRKRASHGDERKSFIFFTLCQTHLSSFCKRSIQPSFFRDSIFIQEKRMDIYFELRRSPKCWTDKGVTTSLPQQCLFHNQHILDFSIKIMLLWENLTMKYIQRLSSFKRPNDWLTWKHVSQNLWNHI